MRQITLKNLYRASIIIWTLSKNYLISFLSWSVLLTSRLMVTWPLWKLVSPYLIWSTSSILKKPANAKRKIRTFLSSSKLSKIEMSLKLSDHVGWGRPLFVSHSCSNYPLGSSANSMDNRTVGRRRNNSQIVSPLNSVDRRMHRRMRLGRIQDMLKVQGHMLRLSRESLDFIRGSSKKPSYTHQWSLWLWTPWPWTPI